MNVVILVALSDHPSDNPDASDYGPGAVDPDDTIEPSAAADEGELNSKSTVSATAKLLRGVKNSTGAFGPLRTVARFLRTFLNNSEVCPPFPTFDLRRLQSF